MPLLWISLAFVLGIWLASAAPLPAPAWAGLGAAALLAEGLRRVIKKRSRRSPPPLGEGPGVRENGVEYPSGFAIPMIFRAIPLPPLLLSFILFCGAARYQSAQPAFTQSDLAWYNDQDIRWEIDGVISQPPEPRQGYTRLRVQVERMKPEDALLFQPVQGRLLASVPPGSWRYGDRVRVAGLLETPQSGELFDYRGWLAYQGIYSQMSPASAHLLLRNQGSALLAALYTLRTQAGLLLYRYFPGPEAALLSGILLGDESGIASDTQQAFRETGTAHLIAISGFNMTILAALALRICTRWLGRWRGAAVAAVAITLYTLLVGAQPPVVRAALFGVLAVLGKQFGRQQQGVNSLAFAAALLALFNPFVLWDVGFQLSAAAVLGLVLLAAPVEALLEERLLRPGGLAERLPGWNLPQWLEWANDFLLYTLAAQLMMLPVLIYHFRELSLVGLLANPLVLPVQPAVMVLGGASVLGGLVWAPLGQVLAWMTWPFVAYTLRVVVGIAALGSGAVHTGQVSFWTAAALYGGLLALAAFLRRPQQEVPVIQKGVPLLVLGAVAALVWNMALHAPDGRLRLVVLDVSRAGQSGDALLIQTPGGQNILLNGGPSSSALFAALGSRLPALGGRIDMLVVASVTDNQLQALPGVIERFPPKQVIWLGATHASRSARLLQAALVHGGISQVRPQAGQALDLGQGAVLRFLTVNPRGGVLLLEWNRFHAVLPLGMAADTLESLAAGLPPGPVSALLLAEAGYAPANPPAWIERWNPQLGLLSVAADDRDSLPDDETLAALAGLSLLRTDRNGWIELATDGQQMWIEVAKR